MNFQELLYQLPECPGSGVLRIKNGPEGFQYIETSLPEFVGPDLSPSSQVEQPANPRILIISAAGAVGKSTLAREIAYIKKAPIWDLAKAPTVGGKSITGQLTGSFGFGLASQVSDMLDNGKLFVIIDALDEARVKASESGYEDFIKDISEIAQKSSKTTFVLLGRTQTAETTWLLLEAAGISASLISIQPFTREQAEKYIESRIRNIDSEAAKRLDTHRQPFETARNIILKQLERAVGGDNIIKGDAVREFLGYAPVLETVAVLLARESNYKEFIASLDTLGRTQKEQIERPLAVLEHVVTRLLEREQTQKLQHNIRPALETLAREVGWNSWDILYTPREQIIRLLEKILGIKLNAAPEMPPSIKAKYEEQLLAWLPEHPFLRDGKVTANVVFESYLFAIAMREYLTSLSKSVEEYIGTGNYKPSRLLADFYFLLGEQRNEEVIAARQIGFLYDSLLAGETDSLRVRLSVELGDPDEADGESTNEGEFEMVYATPTNSDGEQIETRSFKIVGEEKNITFRRQLKEAEIVTRNAVVLESDRSDFERSCQVQRCKFA